MHIYSKSSESSGSNKSRTARWWVSSKDHAGGQGLYMAGLVQSLQSSGMSKMVWMSVFLKKKMVFLSRNF